jgi:hypothetical protein
MTRVVHGVVHGKTIEVIEDLGMSDGQAVELIVTAAPSFDRFAGGFGPRTSPKRLPGPPLGWRPDGTATAAGLLAEEWTEQDDRDLERIHSERQAAKWRELPE